MKKLLFIFKKVLLKVSNSYLKENIFLKRKFDLFKRKYYN